MVRIESASEADLLQILEIEREAILPPWTHGALLAEMFREDSFFAVARDGKLQCGGRENGDVLGFVVLRRMGDEGELLQIAVEKATRRTGVAGLLMGAALSFAEGHALRSVFLEVRKSNEAAIMLYGKHGFKPVRQRKSYYNDPVEDAVVMAREV
jgi:ribosomal-protein-alanine N-acetyltransferase